MQTQKKSSITLSLHQEIEREVQEIEKEMARHTELDGLQVTEAMDRALLNKIEAYEREKEEKRAAEKAGEDIRKIRNVSGEDITSDDAVDRRKPGGKNAFDMDEDYEEPDNHDGFVEFSEELMPDLSRLAMGESGKRRKYTGESTEEKVVYRRKKKKYLVVSLAAVLIIVLGVSVNSVGSKSYWKVLREIVVKDKPVNVISVDDMEKQNTEDVDEITAYREIKEKLNVKPVRLIYKPDDMELENYIIDEEMLTAQLLYKYQDDVIRYTLYINSEDSSWGEKEEDMKIDEYTISVNDVEICVEEFEKLNCKENRQVAKFQYKGIEYQLMGVIKKSEFKKILQNLYFF
ncbi:MAG: DUF4367 domain-containing protein [Schaedlerella sp.]|uniref:DUF4367 domain-containing protein n=1 Tax=Schaedlerella sp. TaxID=2676057 RepID=UPI003526DCAE